MGLAGFCPEPALLGFVLAGVEGMKQLQGLDGLCGEGSAWERWLLQPRFFLVDLEAPVQPQVPLYGRNAFWWCLLPEK